MIDDVALRVRHSFARQSLMATIGAELLQIKPGEVTIALPFRADLVQQHGYLHAGVVTTIVDTACGYAAYTTMAPDSQVLTVEFKVNFVAPALGERLIAHGRVVRAGRTLTVCAGEVHALRNGEAKVVALMQATMIAVPAVSAAPQ